MTIGFFTEGINFDLPHPPINERIIMLVCNVLQHAWTLLIKYPPVGFDLNTANEDTITENLIGIIESHLRISGEVHGFNSALFGRVTREPKITNFDKGHPDKMPDMFFDLKRETLPVLSEQDGLFVECKPIDSAHTVYSCYCKKGLIRFVNGDYAWAMQQALMVGYVKPPYSFDHLANILNDKKQTTNLNVATHELTRGNAIYRSVHERFFNWLDSYGPACPITVSHFWLTI